MMFHLLAQDMQGNGFGWLASAGATTLLGIAVWAFFTERIVPSSVHKRVIDERDKWEKRALDWREVAYKASGVTDKALTVVLGQDSGKESKP